MLYRFKFGVLGLLVLAALNTAAGQARNNPFEVKQRLNDLSSPKNGDTTSLNIIDEAEATNVDNIDQNNISGDSVIAVKSVTKTKNPFEVEHLPIRKSQPTLTIDGSESTKEPLGSNSFLFWFLLLSCALLAIVLNIKSRAIGLLSRSLLNENLLKLFQREESTGLSMYLVLLYFIFFLNISVFIYLINKYFDGATGVMMYIYILAGVIGIYLIKHVGLSIIGSVFLVSKNTDLYSFAIMVFNHFAGLGLIIINFLFAFGPEGYSKIMLCSGLVFIGILVLLRTFRGIFIASEFLTDRIFQIFIYLCAFEIAPLIILIRTVLNLAY
ncbi:MAG: DUF4271 domain-containing protein [Saprospiraceae bacterium]